jgi:hypothetical protein
MTPRYTKDRYAELKKLNVGLKAAIKNRGKLRPNDTSRKIIAVQETMLEVILQMRKESWHLVGLDPDDRKIQGLRDILSEIPKGSAPLAAVDRLAALLEGTLADLAQSAPNNQTQTFEVPPCTFGTLEETRDKPIISESMSKAVGVENDRAEVRSAPISREERLQAFVSAHVGYTLADIRRSASVHKPEFRSWRKDELRDTSVMSRRIEDVLGGRLPLQRNPRQQRKD